nr:ribonuclease H-like domain-containing protein [Tanacetum cinerariifolium]
MASASPICLMARASSTKSWLWHQRLSHLNFDTINDLAINDLVSGLPQFKYHKEHLCPSYELKVERLAKTQDPLALMANSKNPYAFPAPHQDQSSPNLNYLQQPMLNPEAITDPTTAMNMTLALMAKAFKLNYSTSTNNNQRISSNPPRAEGNAAGQNGNQIRCYNRRGVGHYARNCTVRPRRMDAAYLQTQLLI